MPDHDVQNSPEEARAQLEALEVVRVLKEGEDAAEGCGGLAGASPWSMDAAWATFEPTKDPFAEHAERCDRLKAAGNAALKSGDHAAAVKHYTKALSAAGKLNEPSPTEKLQTNRTATLYSNRCAAHLALGEEQKALADAEACAKEAPDWPKAHFRLGKVHMHKRAYLKAYSAFKRGWHLDTSNTELTKACQEAHMAMVGLDQVEQELQNSNTKKPMSQEALGKLRFEHFKAKQVERFEAKKAAEGNKVFSASAAAPVASPSYREEALKRTAMMAAGKTSTVEAGSSSPAAAEDDEVGKAEATDASAAVDVSDAVDAASKEEAAAAAAGEKEEAAANMKETPRPSMNLVKPDPLSYDLKYEAQEDEDGIERLVLTVQTPTAESINDVSLELAVKAARIEAKGAPPLEITLPLRVDDAAAKAKYDKKGRVLSVFLPIMTHGEDAADEVRATQARRQAAEDAYEAARLSGAPPPSRDRNLPPRPAYLPEGFM